MFIAIKGSQEMLPRTQLKKKRGCSQLCFMRDSKEVFHVKGPFLGNLEILTIEVSTCICFILSQNLNYIRNCFILPIIH